MPTRSIDPEIRALVEEFAAQLTALLKNRARAALESSFGTDAIASANASPPTRRGPRPKAAAPAGGGEGKRTRLSADDAIAATEKVFAFIKANPGKRAEVIRAAVGLEKNAYQAAIRGLNDAKRIKAKGERRATTYTAA